LWHPKNRRFDYKSNLRRLKKSAGKYEFGDHEHENAPNPGGANCPDISAAATPAPATNLPRTGGPAGALLLLGLGMTGVGTVLRGVTRRR